MTATQVEVVHHFLNMLDDLSGNWGTSRDNSKWHVDAETYINGVMLTIDADYYMGYVLEIVDGVAVSYLAIAVYHGKHPIHGYAHDFVSWPGNAGTFFNHVPHDEISVWGVQEIAAMFTSYAERDR